MKDNLREILLHQTLYGCKVAIHKPDNQGRMWSCLNPSCPVGPVGWITERTKEHA